MINLRQETDTNHVSVGDPNIVPNKNINIRRSRLTRPKRRENLDEPTLPLTTLDENGLEDDDIALLANAKRMNTDESSTNSVEESDGGDNISEIDEDDDDTQDVFSMPPPPSAPSPPTHQDHTQPTMGFGTANGEDEFGTDDSGSEYKSDPDDPAANFPAAAPSASASVVSSVRSTAPKYRDVLEQKQELLYNLQKLEEQGYTPSRKYNMASNVDQMEAEVKRLKHQRDSRKSVKFQRKCLLAAVSGLCFLNDKFDPIGAKLEGFDKHVAENLSDYDEIFLELYEKYQESFQAEPEIRLLLTLGGSAFFYHIQQSMLKSSNITLDTLLQQNPDLKRSLEQTALNSARQSAQTPFEHMAAANAQNYLNKKTPSTSTTQMRGPQNVDDLLSQMEGQTEEAPRGVNY